MLAILIVVVLICAQMLLPSGSAETKRANDQAPRLRWRERPDHRQKAIGCPRLELLNVGLVPRLAK